jgi:hypothetical protein
MKLAAVLLATLLSAATSSLAQSNIDHAYIIASLGHTNLAYVDVKSIVSKHNTIEASIVWVNYPARKATIGEDTGEISYTVTRSTYDCLARAHEPTYSTDYDISGRVLDSGKVAPMWVRETPRTTGETVLEFVCGGWKTNDLKNARPELNDAVKLALSILAAPPSERPKLIEASKRRAHRHHRTKSE